MKIKIIIVLIFGLTACNGLSVKPHKTSVTYGVSEIAKDDGNKEALTVKQEFLWE